MLGPHILGSNFVAFFMSAEIAAQSARRPGSSMVSRYSSTLASVCFVFSSAMEPSGRKAVACDVQRPDAHRRLQQPSTFIAAWLPGKESNLDLRVQSAASYR